MHLYQGIRMCLQCSGECVIWQESVDEQPWEKVRSRYPFLLYLLCSPCPLWFAVSLSRSTAYCFPENLQGLTETALWLWIVEPISIQVFLVTFTDDWSNITWYGSYTQQIERYPFFYSCAYMRSRKIFMCIHCHISFLYLQFSFESKRRWRSWQVRDKYQQPQKIKAYLCITFTGSCHED
jgi:hypothetical protein